MFRLRLLTSTVLVFAMAGMLNGGYPLAGEQPGNQATGEFDSYQQRQMDMDQQSDIPGVDARLRRARNVIGQPVLSSDGTRVGTIYDLVLTPEHDAISYAVVSRGGIFGIGRDLHAIPWNALRVGFGGQYYVSVTADQLHQTRGFRHRYWPSSPEEGWLPGETAMTAPEGTLEESRLVQQRRASRVLGTPVRNPAGRSIATIRDMVVEMDSGQVLYTVVSFGGTLGFGSQFAAVPPQAIEYWPEQRVARLSVDRDALEAYAFSPNQWPDLSDPAYAQDIRQAFDVEPGSIALGYVPPAEEERPMTTRPRPDGQRTPDTAIQDTEQEPVPSAGMRQIQGTVTDVGVFRPAQGGPETLRLRLRTTEGRLITVHLAPRDYISKQDFYVVTGDSITVTGAESTIGQQPVFLAAQVMRDGQTLRLRDANGQPLWLRSGEPAESMHEHSAEMGRTPEHAEEHHGTDRSM